MRSIRLVLAVSLLSALPRVAFAKTTTVTDVPTLTTALSTAQAGDEIVLANGTYHFTSSPVCSAPGTVNGQIFVHAATPLGAKVEFDAVEGFHVTGPYWRFEGLDVHGVCANDTDCEHAFHVTGAAVGFVLRNNRLVDFNAQLKVNADNLANTWVQPHKGLVEGNVVYDTHARATSNPVTKLNIDTVDDWVVRANFIHDAHKNGGDGVSYQSFIKGGGKNGLYERNLVICALDDASGGTRIGLSFGGGGTAPQFCAPAFNANTPCIPEQTGGVMRNNVIVNCSDVGIYLNQSKDSHILYNTIVGTNGVDFRFSSTSGEADGNLVGSNIRTRDGAAMTLGLNLTGLANTDFDNWFVDPLKGDLRKKGDLSMLIGKSKSRSDVPDDYCARVRSGAYDLGALQVSLGDCVTTKPPGSDAGTDGGPVGGDAAPPNGDAAAMDGGSPSATPSNDAGCGCDTTRTSGSRGAIWLVGALVAFAMRRRRARCYL